MKQRITFLVKDPDSFTPEKLEVKDESLAMSAVEAVKEHRFTISLDELPAGLRRTLKQWNVLHIKWVSPNPYTTVPPFTSRATPGLHVFFSSHKNETQSHLCSLLHSTFGKELKCSRASPAEEVATPLFYAEEAERADAENQYFSYLPSLDGFVANIQEKICPQSSKTCRQDLQTLLKASYFDIDYSSTSTSIVLTAFFDSPPGGWTEDILKPSGVHTIEVGVLTHEPNPDPEDIAFGGFLTMLGRDTAPKATRFQTPTLHYPLSSSLSYTTSFQHPTGLHPTLQLSFASAKDLSPPDASCRLHTHLTLPSYLFIDQYQFSDSLFLSSHRLRALANISGATDLEAPDWVIPQWGSSALFEIAHPGPDSPIPAGPWNVSIPMHLRYLPAQVASHARVPVAWPVVFWACDAEQDGRGNPFDRRNLGYEGAFGDGVRFMHVPPAQGAELVEWIDVPVLDIRATGWVETGTIGVVVAAFLGLCWVLFAGGRKTKGDEKKKQ
ncbi:PIG-X-domain-containing protein [Bimuria novae-zelandiae CBS 107.79]|uniref:Protein PBN1 n=1 Tax=Bimuria novae-zelandiae CBS 107.79 TaxID=1447943 RepID=A0A6A5UMJ9_9PLEO|nr:PIG-X-domain-containing protein [Bimuria novae-zelandiae CBS 107.79]